MALVFSAGLGGCLLNNSFMLSSKLEDDPLYTSYSSMMAKVCPGLLPFVSVVCLPLTSSGPRHWQGEQQAQDSVTTWAPGIVQFMCCVGGDISKPLYPPPKKNLKLCRNSGQCWLDSQAILSQLCGAQTYSLPLHSPAAFRTHPTVRTHL